jgi:hypothetical protein
MALILAIVNIAGTVAVVVSVLFLAWQTRELARQTRHNNAISITSTFHQSAALTQFVHAPLIDDPSLRAYFYGGRECPATDPNRGKLLTLAELLADALEYGLMAAEQIEGASNWLNYPRYVLRYSPIVQEVVSAHKEWWPIMATLLPESGNPRAPCTSGP